MRSSLLWSALFAVSVTGIATDANAGRVPKPVKEKAKEYGKRAAESIAQGEAWNATKRGVRKAGNKLRRQCTNSQVEIMQIRRLR